MPPLLNDHDRPARKRIRGTGQHGLESLDHMRGARVLQAEKDHPGSGFTPQHGEVAEVEIEREDDPILGQGLRETRSSGARCSPSSRR